VRVKLKALEETRSFYKWELKKESLEKRSPARKRINILTRFYFG